MTILQALAERYDRLAARGEASVPGFAPAKIGFTIVLDREGNVVAVEDERTGEGKHLRPKVIEAPEAPRDRRGERIVSGTFWDPSDYALGVPRLDPKETPAKQEKRQRDTMKKHAAFKTRHAALLAKSNDPGCIALLRFLQEWKPDRIATLNYSNEIPGTNIAFQLKGDTQWIHDRSAARSALADESAKRTPKRGICLVTGKEAPIQRLHQPIKGVGDKLAPLVSFNKDAFTSYGKEKGDNAPVSEVAAFAYATALNDLLSASAGTDAKIGRPLYRNRIPLASDTVVFWAETDAAEEIIGGLFEQPPPDERTETAALRKTLDAIAAGQPLQDTAPDLDPATRAFILGLSPNAARLSVRFWLDRSLGDLAERFAAHWRDLHLEPASATHPPAVWMLLYELAPKRKNQKRPEAKDVPMHLAGELTRAILTGGLYPRSLLSQALMRVRADGVLDPLRVALIKAVLTRAARKASEYASRHDPTQAEWKDTLVSLDREETNPGYRLGRLFAVLDAAQYAALKKVNAGVKEKFFAAASATPAHVFPSLLRNAQNHLSAARKKGKMGRAVRLDKEISEILGGLTAAAPFPRALSLDDQGRFVIGFYHEGADLRVPRAKGETIDDPENDAETDTGEE